MAALNPPAYIQASSHPGDVFRRALKALRESTGVVLTGDLAVAQNGSPNMSVNVAAGTAVIDGSENSVTQGSYICTNDAVVNLVVSASDPTNPRNDLVIAKVQDATYSGATNAWSLAVVTGTPAGSPVDPAVPNNAITLARIRVDATVGTIVNAKITDLRPFVHGSISPGAGGFTLWDSTGALKNAAWTDLGVMALRNAAQIPPAINGAVAPSSYGSVPVKIDEQSPSGVSTFTLGPNPLPTGFRHLLIEMQARGDTAASNITAGFRFNNDSGANYAFQRTFSDNTVITGTGSGVTGQTSATGWVVSAASALSGAASFVRIWIPLYNGSTFKKMARIDSTTFYGAAFLTASQLQADWTDIFWNNTAAITRLDILTLTGNWLAGTVATLYGIP